MAAFKAARACGDASVATSTWNALVRMCVRVPLYRGTWRYTIGNWFEVAWTEALTPRMPR
jgi:hypothetical protein